MTVRDLNLYKERMRIIRARLNVFVDKHREIIGDEMEWYLPVIGYLDSLEKAIDYRIAETDVHFFSDDI